MQKQPEVEHHCLQVQYIKCFLHQTILDCRYRFIGSHSRRHGNIYRQCERVDPGHIIKCIYWIKLYYQENWAQEGWGFWGKSRLYIFQQLYKLNELLTLQTNAFYMQNCIMFSSAVLNSFSLLCSITCSYFLICTVGSGGFSYLYEPLWWLGMITSKCVLEPCLLKYSSHMFFKK